MRALGLLVSLLWLPSAGAEPLLNPEHTQPAGYPVETPALQMPQAVQTTPNTSSMPALLQTPETLPPRHIAPAPVPAAPEADAYTPTPAPPPALSLAPGQPIERVVWTKAPIPITLPVGIERMVVFPTTVRFGPSPELAAKLRDPQSLEGTLYLTATEPFPPARALVQECTPSGLDAESCTPSGRTYILDLQAVAQGASSAPVQVFASPEPAVANTATPSPDAFTVPRGYTPVELVRFAFQQLYAPSRLLRELPAVSRVPLHMRNSVPLYEGGALEAKPEVSWSDGMTYVTAVMLQNRTRVPQTIDPRAIRGQWLSRSLLWGRTRLAPRGDARGADSAPVILVSPRPFTENLRWLIR